MTQNCFCLISDPNLKDVNEDMATVVGPLMQKHGLAFKEKELHQSQKDEKQKEKERIIKKNKGRIESQMMEII